MRKDENATEVQKHNNPTALAAVATQTERLTSTDCKVTKVKAPKGKLSQERMDGKKRALNLLQQSSKAQKKAKKIKKIH